MKFIHTSLLATLFLATSLFASCNLPRNQVYTKRIEAKIQQLIDNDNKTKDVNDVNEKDQSQQAEGIELPKISDNDLIVKHIGFTLSFNEEKLVPKWVAWQLTSDETNGDVPRYKNFKPDTELAWHLQVNTNDYKNTGFDRGHMVPAADMKWDVDAMKECFLMSNICPQNHNLNGGSWKVLEEKCRDWANNDGAIYIVCGPIFAGEESYIGKEHKIGVPNAFFKVVLSLAKGREKAIGFIYINKAGKQTISQTATSVDDVEKLTGIDFFPSLPDEIEEQLESNFDISQW